jgi:diguanylate cyclase (GGDEF)-like protein
MGANGMAAERPINPVVDHMRMDGSSQPLAMHHSPSMVLLSVLVAMLAGHIALDLTQRAARWRTPAAGVAAAALTMGAGIWSMHFIGMLSMDMGAPVRYRLDLVAVSMLAAVGGAGVALWVITRPGARHGALFSAAGFMGAAVGAMHYLGVASMEMPARVRWNLPLVGASLVIGYGAALFALWLVFERGALNGPWRLGRRLGAAVAFGLGVGGLHYTAMAAARFEPIAGHVADRGMNTNAIAALLVLAAAIMLVVLLAGAHLDQRKAALAQDLEVVAKLMREVGRSTDARASICRAVCRLTGADYGVLVEPDGAGHLVLAAAHGLDRPPLRISLDEPSGCARAFLTGEPWFVTDVMREAGVLASSRGNGSASALYEPVVLDSRPVGVLYIAWTRRQRRLEDRAFSVAGLLAAEAAFVIERADLTARLERLARTDELTGLANRRTANEELERFLARAARDGEPLSVAMLDIDHFKAYNDTHGHAGGDRLLRAAAAAWTTAMRSGDHIARYGGEEFLVLYPRCAAPDAACAADRLRSAMPPAATCSVGVAAWDGSETGQQLIARADAALYSAKAAGRDRTAIAARPAAHT